jgi:hypothetical protein
MKGMFKQLVASCRKLRNVRRVPAPRPGARPGLESLEDRAMPSASPLNVFVDASNLYNAVAKASKSATGQGGQIGKAVLTLCQQVVIDEINGSYSAAVKDTNTIGALLLVQLANNTPKAQQAAFMTQIWAPYSQLSQDANSVLSAANSNLTTMAGLLNHNSSVASQGSYYLEHMVTS